MTVDNSGAASSTRNDGYGDDHQPNRGRRARRIEPALRFTPPTLPVRRRWVSRRCESKRSVCSFFEEASLHPSRFAWGRPTAT